MYRIRLFAVRHSPLFEWIYARVEAILVSLHPIFTTIGYHRVERPVALIEKATKSLLFDCKMCGQCVLSSTGMSCPMNCPKELRNGPCGGVREGGFCEVKTEMKCVWVLAWDGASRMKNGERVHEVLPPVDQRLKGTSSWLSAAREKALQSRGACDGGRATLAQAFSEARKIEPTTAPLVTDPARTDVKRSK